MHKALLIAAACLGLITTSNRSNAAELSVQGARVGYAVAYPAAQIYSLRRSYPGYRPHGTTVVAVVECPSVFDLWENYRFSDAAYCRR